jgi:hypothetical protein
MFVVRISTTLKKDQRKKETCESYVFFPDVNWIKPCGRVLCLILLHAIWSLAHHFYMLRSSSSGWAAYCISTFGTRPNMAQKTIFLLRVYLGLLSLIQTLEKLAITVRLIVSAAVADANLL